MITTRKKELIKTIAGIPYYRMELDADTYEELPSTDFVSGQKVYQGSIAWVISEGKFYGMKSDGTWVKQGE